MNDNIFVTHRLFFDAIREALLAMVNAVELEMRRAGVYASPTTAEIRRLWKEQQRSIISAETTQKHETINTP